MNDKNVLSMIIPISYIELLAPKRSSGDQTEAPPDRFVERAQVDE